MEIRQCILTNNDCYKQNKKITPTGIVVHSTGANNPKLSRYVQPDDGILGDNKYDNDWNRSGIEKCVHAMIGKDKNGIVRVYQTLPWDCRPWGCGTGSKGSYNNNYIQFEICEDDLMDEKYFNEAFSLAVELCAYLVKQYNIPTKNIVSHAEAHKLGYASNHADCDHWLKKFGKTMDWLRTGVDNALKPVTATTSAFTPKIGDTVMFSGNTHYTSATSDRAIACKGGKATLTAISKGSKHPYHLIRVTGSGATVYGWVDENKVSAVTTTTTATTTPTATVSKYYNKYTGTSTQIDVVLRSIGVPTKYIGKWRNRQPIAKANGIKAYVGLASQNLKLISLAKQGKLLKP